MSSEKLKRLAILGVAGTTALANTPVSMVVHAEEVPKDESSEGETPGTDNGSEDGKDEDKDKKEDPGYYSTVEIVDAGSDVSNAFISDGKCFFTKMYLGVAGVASVEGDKVTKIQMLDSSDDSIVYAEKSDYSEGDKLVFAVPDGAKGLKLRYTVVRDSEDFTFDEEVSSKVDALSEVSEYVKVDSAFSLDKADNTCEIKEADGINYLVKDGTITYNYSGMVAIDAENTKCTVNGEEVEISQSGEGNEVSLSINTEGIPEGQADIELSVKDMLGWGVSDSFSYYILRKPVSVVGVEKGVTYEVDGVTYVNPGFAFSVKYPDNKKLISSVRLLKDETEILDIKDEELVPISEEGIYKIKVVDVVGNTTVLSLDELFPDMTSNISIDSDAVNIGTSISGEAVLDTYYPNEASLDVSLKDEKGIGSYKVSVNGVAVSSESGNLGTEKSLVIPIPGDLPSKDGIYNIEICAVDAVGNTSNEKLVVKCDISNPGTTEGTISGEYNIVDGKLYTSKGISFSFKPYDDESGVSLSEVYRDGVLVASGNTCVLNVSGTYSVRVVDNVGHESLIPIGEVLETPVEEVVVDPEAPRVAKATPIKGVEIEGKTWAKEAPVVSYKIVDEELNSILLKVNGEDVDIVKEEEGEDLYTIPTESYQEGNNDVELIVSDKAGNTVRDSFSFVLDTKSPINVTATIDKDYTEVDGKVYFTSTPTVVVTANDEGSGVKEYSIGEEKNETGSFEMGNGVHTVVVSDVIGNSTELLNIAELLGMKGSEFVIDGSSPEITRESGFSEDLKDGETLWFSKKPVLRYFVKDDNLDEVIVTVNGVNTVQDINESGDYIVDLSSAKDGLVSVRIVARDKSGNSTEDSFVFNLDTKSPDNLKASIKGEFIEKDGAIYFKSNPLVSFDVEDEGVGVDAILVNGKRVDGNEFEVSSGEYKVVVVDKLGNVTDERSLPELLGLNGTSFVVDSTDPNITRESGFEGDLRSDDGSIWYSKKPNLVYAVSDENTNSVMLVVNGEEFPQSLSKDGKYLVNLEGVTDGKVSVSIKVTDKAGNVSEDIFTFNLDTQAPTDLSAMLDRTFIEADGKLYFDGVPNLALTAKDAGVGISDYILNENKSNTGLFTLGEGEYLVSVVDKLGYSSNVVTLASLLRVESNTIVIDEENPLIERISGFNYDYKEDGKEWYSSIPDLVYSVKDTYLREVSISVNGKETFRGVSENNNYGVDLSGIPDGEVQIVISAVDKAGNTSESTYAFYLDRECPGNLSVSVNKKFVNLPNGVFFKEIPTLTINAEDTGVGLGTFSLNGAKSEEGTYTLTGGEYTVRVEDKLGNTTDEVSLASLLGLKSNNIVIDGVSPVIGENSGFSSDYTENGREWYSRVPRLVCSVRDSDLKEVSISVNGEVTSMALTKDNLYSVPLSNVPDGRVTVVVRAEDFSGNSSRSSYVFYLDRKAPTDVEAKLDNSDFFERDTGIFFKSAPNVTISAKDEGVGVGSYRLNDSKNSDGRFRLTGGEYSVVVEDQLGNKTNTLSLRSLLGIKNSKFVVDGDAPEISASKPRGGVNNWYKEDQVYSVKISDNVAVQSARITINGRVVDTFESQGKDVKSVSLSGSTAKASANSDGSYNVEVRVTDKAGNQSEWKDTIKIDKTKPVIDRFVFTGADISDGATINGSDRYGFFYDGSASVSIYASDGNVSSGLKEVVVTLNNKNGGTSVKTIPVEAGAAVLSLPNNFKGTISAHAVDNVGNAGSENRPDGVVTGSSNWHKNSIDLSLNLPKEDGKDSSGLPLYNKTINIDALIGCKSSGIRQVKWGIDNKTMGTSNVSSNGKISGSGDVREVDSNLVLSMSKVLPVSNNSNNIKVWVTVTDRLGHTSEISRNISIDTDKPVVTVSYDSKVTDGSFYKTGKTATISVDERNFSKDNVKVTGKSGTLGNWSKSGNRWVATMVFSEDGEYDWGLVVTDLAGNSSNGYSSPKFSIDRNAPKVRFEYDTKKPKNKKYYDTGRKVTVVVDDFNFDEKSVEFEGDGKLGKWVKSGDVYRAIIDCSKDGSYKFSFSCSDKSGNKSDTIESEEFVVDTKKPTVKVEGVSNGISYKKNIKLDVNFEDVNLDKDNVRMSLVGRKNGVIDLKSSFGKDSGSIHFDGFDDDEKYDDVYTLRVSVADKAGNTIEKVYKFSVNRYGSHYSSEDAKLFGNYLKSAKDVVLKEENVDKLDVSKCRVVVVKDGKTLSGIKSKVKILESESTSGWAYEYRVDSSVFDEDGMYQIQIYSLSEDGTSYSSVSEEYSFILDSTEPEVVLSGIENGGKYREYKKKVTVDVRDLSGVDKVVAKVNGSEVVCSESNGIYSFDVLESKEIQNVTVEVTDKAGNTTITGISGFYLSTNPIVFLINQPWFKMASGLVGSFLILIILLISRRRYLVRKEEKKAMEEQKDLLDKSRSSSSGSQEGKN